MHHALNIEEIANALCHSLPSTSDSCHDVPVLDRRSLAALARTCRSLYEPSMNALWSTPRSLETLAVYAVNEITTQYAMVSLLFAAPQPHLHTQPMEQEFDREPTLDDWAPILRNAHRVRSISVVQVESIVFSRFLKIVAQRFESTEFYQPLFPKLRHIYHGCKHPPEVQLSHIPLFAGSTLASVTVCQDSGSPDGSTHTLNDVATPPPSFIPSFPSSASSVPVGYPDYPASSPSRRLSPGVDIYCKLSTSHLAYAGRTSNSSLGCPF